jgi:two-component system, NtrC family, sensor kinase
MKVMVVDDDPMQLEHVCQILRTNNYEPKGYTEPQKAIERFERESPGVVLLGYSKPDMTGVQMCEALRKIDPKAHVPIILLSTDKSQSKIAFEAGAQDFLAKPVSDFELVSKVKLHIERSKLILKLRLQNNQLQQEHNEQKNLIEQLKEAQAQLLHQEKMASVGQIAAGVAHEINNPIGYIGSNLVSLEAYLGDLFDLLKAYENLEKTCADDAPETQQISKIKQEIDYEFLIDDVDSLIAESKEGISRVKQIVNDLKDFSHFEEIEWQWTDLHKGIDSTLNIVNNELKYKADIVKEYGDIPVVECIPSQINQIIMNLCVNASHAIEERGIITIRTSQPDENHVLIQVSDTGKGINEENLKKIFNPFFTTKPIGQGTGLGLSLAITIIETHRGKISADSEVGKGTTFNVLLPIKQTDKKKETIKQ